CSRASRFPSTPCKVQTPMRALWIAIPVLTLAALAGCSSGDTSSISVYPVTGRVVLANGKAARGASIVLIGRGVEGGANGVGTLDKDGRFKMTCLGDREGMMPGKYKVVINPRNKAPGVSSEDQSFGMSNIPRKYWDDETTDLFVEVKSGENNFELTLK